MFVNSKNIFTKLEDIRLGSKCILNAPAILTQQELNIIGNLSMMLRGVNVELAGSINYTYIPGVSSNNW